jgi:cardiolipin synthase
MAFPILNLVQGGKPYFDLLARLIDDSKDTIHLQFYIFDEGHTGNLIIEHLIQAAKRGVKIYLLVDGYASQNLSAATLEKLRSNHIHFKFFEPLLKSKRFYFGRRLHHKIVVIDTFKAMIGGLNVSDRYNDLPGKPAWLDFAIYLEGYTAQQLCILCWKTWKNFPVNLGKTPCENIFYPPDLISTEIAEIKMLRNDWVRRKIQVTNTYHKLIKSAKKDIIILSSYFLPGMTIRKLLVRAIARGVRVRVISAGHSDVAVAKDAERWLYDWILRNNIELYEYQPRVLHGKLSICDHQWFTLGSYNINDISARASIELNLEIHQKEITDTLCSQVESIMEHDCIRITKEVRKKTTNIFLRLRQWFAYEFIRIVLYLFTFYFKQSR